MISPLNPTLTTGLTPPPAPDANHLQNNRMWEAAKQLEATFLSEMLALGGLGNQENSFSGGIGEQNFSSFLRDEQARLMVERGGIGLAETFFRAMGEKNAD